MVFTNLLLFLTKFLVVKVTSSLRNYCGTSATLWRLTVEKFLHQITLSKSVKPFLQVHFLAPLRGLCLKRKNKTKKGIEYHNQEPEHL